MTPTPLCSSPSCSEPPSHPIHPFPIHPLKLFLAMMMRVAHAYLTLDLSVLRYTQCSTPSEMRTLYARLKAASQPAFQSVKAKDDFLWDLSRGLVSVKLPTRKLNSAERKQLQPPAAEPSPVPTTTPKARGPSPFKPTDPTVATFPLFFLKPAPLTVKQGTAQDELTTPAPAHAPADRESIESTVEDTEDEVTDFENGAGQDGCDSCDAAVAAAPLTSDNLARFSRSAASHTKAWNPVAAFSSPAPAAANVTTAIAIMTPPPKQAPRSPAVAASAAPCLAAPWPPKAPAKHAAADGAAALKQREAMQRAWAEAFPGMKKARPAAQAAARPQAEALAPALEYDHRWLFGAATTGTASAAASPFSSPGYGAPPETIKRRFSFRDMLYKPAGAAGSTGRKAGWASAKRAKH